MTDKLIHISGNAVADKNVKDSVFGVDENALALKRVVEMYQWEEHESTETKKNAGGSETKKTTYSYHETWSEEVINSTHFKKRGYDNPRDIPYASNLFVAENIKIGDLTLGGDIINELAPAHNTLEDKGFFENYSITPESLGKASTDVNRFKISGGALYTGNPDSPAIGDLRVTFKIIPQPVMASVIGMQQGGTINAYEMEDGVIALIQKGGVNADAMFSKAASDNMLKTWGLRFLALLLLWFGLMLLFDPIQVISDVVPTIGRVAENGIRILSFILASVITLINIAFAWVYHRPIIAAILFAVVLVILVASILKARSRKKFKTIGPVEI